MRQTCLLCQRQHPDGNLHCEQSWCPGEASPWLLEPGEHLAELEITRLLTVTRSAALYAAMRQDEPALLKVAHQGSAHKDRLKREAELLAVAQVKQVAAPFLPVLLPAKPSAPEGAKTGAKATEKTEVYGKTVLDGKLLYYYVCRYSEGESLRDLMRKQPQLWVQHAGLIAVQLCTAITYLHRRNLYHYGLSPESVLVRFSAETPPLPRILLVDLGLAAATDQVSAAWYPDFVMPAYTAPELLDERRSLPKAANQPVPPDPRVDVYALGLILAELLTGRPVFNGSLRSDMATAGLVIRNQRTPMDRGDDLRAVAQLALQASDPQLSKRIADPATLGKQLLPYFGDVPPEKAKEQMNRRNLWIGAAAAITLALLAAIALSLT